MDEGPGGPPSAAPDPSSPADEEAGGWVLVPASEVGGADAPGVFHWEDLQQELARLWSLSAALRAARDRRADHAARIEGALQARRAFLQQDDELAEPRQKKKLHERSDHMADLKIRTKKLSEDVEGQREQLRVRIATLMVAGKALGAASGKLEEANKLLSGENGHGRLQSLEQKLRMRRQHMITQAAHVYPVRPLDEQSPAVKRGLTVSIIKTSSAESVLPNGSQNRPLAILGLQLESVLPNGSQNRPLAILGLQLSKLSVKKTGYFSDKTVSEIFYCSGICRTFSLIAAYLNVLLRYPLRFGGLRSYVLDHAPSVELSSITSVVNSVPPSTSMRTMEFPLFFDGPETTRSAYAMFLLNKDIEQLLNYIDAESLGPRHVFANLKQLTTIIRSQHFISN